MPPIGRGESLFGLGYHSHGIEGANKEGFFGVNLAIQVTFKRHRQVVVQSLVHLVEFWRL